MTGLCLFRHGPADLAAPGGSDEARPLTAEGRRKTLRAARGVRRLDLGIDRIYTSPLVRAVQTAEVLAGVLELEPPRVTDALLPEAPPSKLAELLADPDAQCPVLVGHNPNLTGVLDLLLGSTESEAWLLKKAGLAHLRLRRLRPEPRATLLLLLTPSVLRRLGR